MTSNKNISNIVYVLEQEGKIVCFYRFDDLHAADEIVYKKLR